FPKNASFQKRRPRPGGWPGTMAVSGCATWRPVGRERVKEPKPPFLVIPVSLVRPAVGGLALAVHDLPGAVRLAAGGAIGLFRAPADRDRLLVFAAILARFAFIGRGRRHITMVAA